MAKSNGLMITFYGHYYNTYNDFTINDFNYKPTQL